MAGIVATELQLRQVPPWFVLNLTLSNRLSYSKRGERDQSSSRWSSADKEDHAKQQGSDAAQVIASQRRTFGP